MMILTAANPSPPSRLELERRLTEQILDGTLQAGDKLPSEREIAVVSRLSRPVVREVLRALQERGLLEIFPARGAYVREAGSMDLAQSMGSVARLRGATPRDLVEARVMLEEQSAFLAANRADEADVKQLRQLMDAFDKATNLVDRARCDLAFHALIARASRNPVLETMFGSIAPLVFELQLRSLGDPTVADEGAPLHQRILAAINDQDAELAGETMKRHVLLAYELYGADLDIPLDVLARDRLAGLVGDYGSLEDVIADALSSYARMEMR